MERIKKCSLRRFKAKYPYKSEKTIFCMFTNGSLWFKCNLSSKEFERLFKKPNLITDYSDILGWVEIEACTARSYNIQGLQAVNSLIKMFNKKNKEKKI